MSDRCSLLFGKHKLSTIQLPSNLPLFVCSRCHRVWEFNGAERKYFFGIPGLRNSEWSVGNITLHADELNPVLIEYFIKFNGIKDKATLDALRKLGKESKFSLAPQLFKN